MDTIELYTQFCPADKEVNEALIEVKKKSELNRDENVLKKLFSLIDLTSLNTTDNYTNIQEMCQKVNNFSSHYPNYPNVAAICIYPPFVSLLKEKRKATFSIAAVGAGFPSSQTYIDVKLSEASMIAEEGADELDIVISVGSFLNGDYSTVSNEIEMIKESIDGVHLKTILETGALDSAENIWNASFLAMQAGSDFIKTSTGKTEPAASPEAVYVMCKAIKQFYESTGKKTGIKPAGGIASVNDALIYYTIVKEVLGEDWLNNKLFRIGASRLANNILSELENTTVKYF